MKLLQFIFFSYFSFLTFLTYAQKHDNIWLFGREPFLIPGNADSRVVFDSLPPIVSLDDSHSIPLGQCGTTICDENGKLIFYSNCYQVANADHELMENGDSLSNCEENGYYGSYYIGGSLPQGIVVLPDPADLNVYHIIQLQCESTHLPAGQPSFGLVHSVIDMTKDGGMGTVTLNNEIVLKDTLQAHGLTAVKHANGRDWWILVFEFFSKKVYRVLLTGQGIYVVGTQLLDIEVFGFFGMNTFSPDGSKFVITPHRRDNNERYWMYLFDFERCTGLLSNRKSVDYSGAIYDGNGDFWYYDPAWGASFSPNSRFLYLFLYLSVVQFDLDALNLENSIKTVAEYDGFEDDWHPYLAHTHFGMSQLGPDGRIYANTTQPTKYLHYIENPNNIGLGCLVRQHGLQLAAINGYAMPNHPNYRLGPLEGSGCDTLEIKKAVFIHAHPYPVEACTGGDTHFEVTAFGTGLGYQWQMSGDGGSSWTNLSDGGQFSGAQTEYLSLKNIPSEFEGQQFRCIVSGNVDTKTSSPAALTLVGHLPHAAFDYTQDKDSVHFVNQTTDADFTRWYFGAGDSTLTETASRMFRPAGSHPVMLVAYNACGQDTQLQNILIPEFEANFSADKSIGCAPLTVNFSSDTPYRTHNHFYTFPGGTPAFAYTQTGDKTIVYNTPGVFDVSMIAYTQALAESDTLLKSGYITVLPSPNPNMEISLLQIDQSVQLSTDFETGIDYAWLISTGDTLAGPNAAYTFDQPGVYEVILSASNQCGVVFDTVQINVEGVEAAFAVSQTIGCAPFTVQFDNTTAVVVDSVHWYFPGGSPSFSTEQNPSVMYNEPGEYDVRQVAFANGLRDTLDSPALLRVLPNDCPMVQVFAQVNGLGATLWTNCQQGNQYTWDLGDGAVFHTQGIAYQYDSAGVYEVRLIVEGLCGTDTATLTLDITDPLGATTAVSGTPVAVLLRPNPARDLVLLEFQPGLPADRDMEIRLLNKVGRKVLHRKNENANSVALPLHEIPAGVYQLQWKLDDQPWRVRKLVVVK